MVTELYLSGNEDDEICMTGGNPSENK